MCVKFVHISCKNCFITVPVDKLMLFEDDKQFHFSVIGDDGIYPITEEEYVRIGKLIGVEV